MVPGSSTVSGASRAGHSRNPGAIEPFSLGPQPKTIGKFQVLDRIGSGAFGAVYRCHDPGLDRIVAVKVLISASHAGPELMERFKREARAGARLSHPHIVQVFDFGVDEGYPFLVMEFVEGQTLDCLIGSPRLNVETTLRVVFHLAQALQAAHNEGVIHRDLKPANVIIDHSGRPRLTDFGLARLASEATKLSQTGELLGTPRYMSPEQVLLPAEEIDHRTDLYSLGAILYEMLTGSPAADGPTPLAVIKRVAEQEPMPIRDLKPEIPEEVASICQKLMERNREIRYQSGAEVANDIQDYILRKLFGKPEIELLASLPRSPEIGFSRRFWIACAVPALVLPMIGFGLARWVFPLAQGGNDPSATVVGNESKRADLAATMDRVGAEFPKLAAIADDKTYRDKLAELLDELNSVLRAYPGEPSALSLRGRLLRKAGEYLGAIQDFDNLGAAKLDKTILLERSLSRFLFERLFLGSLSETSLHPAPSMELRDDFSRLSQSQDAPHKYIGQLGQALWSPDIPPLSRLLSDRPKMVPGDMAPDVLMIEAAAMAKLAENLHKQGQSAEVVSKPDLRKNRDDWDTRCLQAIRKGLEADPRHLGLLFMKANGWHRRVDWEVADGEDPEKTLKRHRSGFEGAYLRYRTVSPRLGLEAATGRAVLLSNFGRNELALDQLTEASGRSTLPPSVVALKAWLQIYSPPDGELSAAFSSQILQQLAPSFETPPEEFSLYLVHAIAKAASGNWEDARRDLIDGSRNYRGGPWPPAGGYENWCKSARGPTTKFLDATLDLLGGLPTPGELRFRLQEVLMKRLLGPDGGNREGLDPEEVKSLTAWGNYRLAKYWADKNDRANALKHIRLALEFRLPDLTSKTFREDDDFKAWNNEEDFTRLYAEFEKKGEGG